MYEKHFKLDRKPFQLSPDPAFFFGSSVHKRALAYLQYGLSQAEGFIAITGDVGTGKTTLARMLFDELPKDEVIAAQISTTQVEADDLLRMVLQAFGLKTNRVAKSTLLNRFETFLHEKVRDGKRVLLIVDEAQNLSWNALEELRMLSNFHSDDKPLLQSFLLGQSQFKRVLQHPDLEQLRQRFIAACHLSPLNEKETREYIAYRLETAGWKGEPEFRDDAFPEIYQHTQGVPRRINSLADRLMLYAYLEDRKSIDADLVNVVADELEDELSFVDDEIPSISDAEITQPEIEQPKDSGKKKTNVPAPAKFQWDYLELRITALESRVQILNKYVRQRFSEMKRG